VPLAADWAERWHNIDMGRNVEGNRRELRLLMEFAGLGGADPPREFTAPLREGYLRAVLGSNSWLAVVMITDVLGLRLRFNTPGTLGSHNWSERLPATVKQLEEDPAFLAAAEAYARLAHEAKRGAKPL